MIEETKSPPPIAIKFKASHRLYHALIEAEQVMQMSKEEIIPLVLQQVLIEDYNSIESHRKLDSLLTKMEMVLGKLEDLKEKANGASDGEILNPNSCLKLPGVD